MMRQAFFNEARIPLLRQALRRWDQTPFRQHCAIAGVGVDCVRFVREVYRECGVDVGSAEDIPRYSLSWGVHQEQSQVLAWLLECPQARERISRIDVEDPRMGGDIVAIQRMRSVHHIGIIDPDLQHFWHVDIPCGVQRLPLALCLQLQLTIKSIFRLTEYEFSSSQS
jgi:hypothetical protein